MSFWIINQKHFILHYKLVVNLWNAYIWMLEKIFIYDTYNQIIELLAIEWFYIIKKLV